MSEVPVNIEKDDRARQKHGVYNPELRNFTNCSQVT